MATRPLNGKPPAQHPKGLRGAGRPLAGCTDQTAEFFWLQLQPPDLAKNNDLPSLQSPRSDTWRNCQRLGV